MAAKRAAVLLGLMSALAIVPVHKAMAADIHHRRAHHARHYYPADPPVVPLGYAYGGYQRGYSPGYGYVAPGYDGPGFGFPGY